MSIRTDRCPTCGQAVQTHISSEGTSCYLPTGEVEWLREALGVLVPYLKAANAGDGGAIPLALDTIKATLADQAGKRA